MTIKDWFIIIAVSSLVLERIIRWIFRFIRPEKEIDNIAMDMVKLNEKRRWDSTPLTFFYFYKAGLKYRIRWRRGYIDYMTSKEEEINRKLERLDYMFNNALATIEELKSILSDWQELEKQGKLPDELKTFVEEAQILVSMERDAGKFREEGLRGIINKAFKRTTALLQKNKVKAQNKADQK